MNSKPNMIFLNRSFDKKRLKALLLWFRLNLSEGAALKAVEILQGLGFRSATKGAISLGLDDLKTPASKGGRVFQAQLEVALAHHEHHRGNRTPVELFQHLVDTWHRTSQDLTAEVVQLFHSTERVNPVYMMAFSGARGNISQVRQLVGMRGLMADPRGQIVGFPILSNFREGLTITEYFVSCYGARKGVVDTAIRTADAGYLTRRLADVSHHVVVRTTNCGTHRNIRLRDIKEGQKTILSLSSRLVGRVLAEHVGLDSTNLTKPSNVRFAKSGETSGSSLDPGAATQALCFANTPTSKAVTPPRVCIEDANKEAGKEGVNLMTNPTSGDASKMQSEIDKELSRKRRDILIAKPSYASPERTGESVNPLGFLPRRGRSSMHTLRGPLGDDITQSSFNSVPLTSENSKKVVTGGVHSSISNKIAFRNEEITPNLASKLALQYVEISVRSPLSCSLRWGVCQLCYGWGLSEGRRVTLGEAVGIIAAQSIGEPGTQLTLRTFHTGGVFSGDLLNEIRAPYIGMVLFPQPLQGLLVRTPHGQIAFLTKVSGKMIVFSTSNTLLPLSVEYIEGNVKDHELGTPLVTDSISKVSQFASRSLCIEDPATFLPGRGRSLMPATFLPGRGRSSMHPLWNKKPSVVYKMHTKEEEINNFRPKEEVDLTSGKKDDKTKKADHVLTKKHFAKVLQAVKISNNDNQPSTIPPSSSKAAWGSKEEENLMTNPTSGLASKIYPSGVRKQLSKQRKNDMKTFVTPATPEFSEKGIIWGNGKTRKQDQEFLLQPSTVIFVRQKEQVYQNQLLAEFSSSTLQSTNDQIEVTQQVLSEAAGQVWFKEIHYGNRKGPGSGPLGTHFSSQKLGGIWVLTGSPMPIASPFNDRQPFFFPFSSYKESRFFSLNLLPLTTKGSYASPLIRKGGCIEDAKAADPSIFSYTDPTNRLTPQATFEKLKVDVEDPATFLPGRDRSSMPASFLPGRGRSSMPAPQALRGKETNELVSEKQEIVALSTCSFGHQSLISKKITSLSNNFPNENFFGHQRLFSKNSLQRNYIHQNRLKNYKISIINLQHDYHFFKYHYLLGYSQFIRCVNSLSTSRNNTKGTLPATVYESGSNFVPFVNYHYMESSPSDVGSYFCILDASPSEGISKKYSGEHRSLSLEDSFLTSQVSSNVSVAATCLPHATLRGKSSMHHLQWSKKTSLSKGTLATIGIPLKINDRLCWNNLETTLGWRPYFKKSQQKRGVNFFFFPRLHIRSLCIENPATFLPGRGRSSMPDTFLPQRGRSSMHPLGGKQYLVDKLWQAGYGFRQVDFWCSINSWEYLFANIDQKKIPVNNLALCDILKFHKNTFEMSTVNKAHFLLGTEIFRKDFNASLNLPVTWWLPKEGKTTPGILVKEPFFFNKDKSQGQLFWLLKPFTSIAKHEFWNLIWNTSIRSNTSYSVEPDYTEAINSNTPLVVSAKSKRGLPIPPSLMHRRCKRGETLMTDPTSRLAAPLPRVCTSSANKELSKKHGASQKGMFKAEKGDKIASVVHYPWLFLFANHKSQNVPVITKLVQTLDLNWRKCGVTNRGIFSPLKQNDTFERFTNLMWQGFFNDHILTGNTDTSGVEENLYTSEGVTLTLEGIKKEKVHKKKTTLAKDKINKLLTINPFWQALSLTNYPNQRRSSKKINSLEGYTPLRDPLRGPLGVNNSSDSPKKLGLRWDIPPRVAAYGQRCLSLNKLKYGDGKSRSTFQRSTNSLIQSQNLAKVPFDYIYRFPTHGKQKGKNKIVPIHKPVWLSIHISSNNLSPFSLTPKVFYSTALLQGTSSFLNPPGFKPPLGGTVQPNVSTLQRSGCHKRTFLSKEIFSSYTTFGFASKMHKKITSLSKSTNKIWNMRNTWKVGTRKKQIERNDGSLDQHIVHTVHLPVVPFPYIIQPHYRYYPGASSEKSVKVSTSPSSSNINIPIYTSGVTTASSNEKKKSPSKTEDMNIGTLSFNDLTSRVSPKVSAEITTFDSQSKAVDRAAHELINPTSGDASKMQKQLSKPRGWKEENFKGSSDHRGWLEGNTFGVKSKRAPGKSVVVPPLLPPSVIRGSKKRISFSSYTTLMTNPTSGDASKMQKQRSKQRGFLSIEDANQRACLAGIEDLPLRGKKVAGSLIQLGKPFGASKKIAALSNTQSKSLSELLSTRGFSQVTTSYHSNCGTPVQGNLLPLIRQSLWEESCNNNSLPATQAPPLDPLGDVPSENIDLRFPKKNVTLPIRIIINSQGKYTSTYLRLPHNNRVAFTLTLVNPVTNCSFVLKSIKFAGSSLDPLGGVTASPRLVAFGHTTEGDKEGSPFFLTTEGAATQAKSKKQTKEGVNVEEGELLKRFPLPATPAPPLNLPRKVALGFKRNKQEFFNSILLLGAKSSTYLLKKSLHPLYGNPCKSPKFRFGLMPLKYSILPHVGTFRSFIGRSPASQAPSPMVTTNLFYGNRVLTTYSAAQAPTEVSAFEEEKDFSSLQEIPYTNCFSLMRRIMEYPIERSTFNRWVTNRRRKLKYSPFSTSIPNKFIGLDNLHPRPNNIVATPEVLAVGTEGTHGVDKEIVFGEENPLPVINQIFAKRKKFIYFGHPIYLNWYACHILFDQMKPFATYQSLLRFATFGRKATFAEEKLTARFFKLLQTIPYPEGVREILFEIFSFQGKAFSSLKTQKPMSNTPTPMATSGPAASLPWRAYLAGSSIHSLWSKHAVNEALAKHSMLEASSKPQKSATVLAKPILSESDQVTFVGDHFVERTIISPTLRYSYSEGGEGKIRNFSAHLENSVTRAHDTFDLFPGQLIAYGENINNSSVTTESGQVLYIDSQKTTLRKAQTVLIYSQAIIAVLSGEWIRKGTPLMALSYQKLVTGDIVQGLPKIEQFFEAPVLKDGTFWGDSLQAKLNQFFQEHREQLPLAEAVRKGFSEIQRVLIEGVQRVYISQGVLIADKHLEVIVRQMTCKGRILYSGDTGFLRNELVSLDKIESVNQVTYGQKALYHPQVRGITDASLESESFLSAASFQETTRVLSRDAIIGKTDLMRGLKERVIVGELVQAGTGLANNNVYSLL